MDLDAVASLFCADCVVEYGPEERLQSRGRVALRKGLERLWRWTRTSHHTSNIQVSFGGEDEAAANSYVMAWHERPDGTTATVWGQYEDRLRRGPDGWRIAHRRQTMNGNDEASPSICFGRDGRPSARVGRAGDRSTFGRELSGEASKRAQEERCETMKKRRLGLSALEVAPLCFGGNVFGWTADEERSFALLDAFLDAGFNFVDTADVYSAWWRATMVASRRPSSANG